ncbi:hypothetical protein N665_0610s0007 [Sinapis alba]|nr:hypothetical protein N665_0610s0007 [Sinapis alba]
MTKLISQTILTNPLTQTQPLTHSKKDEVTLDVTPSKVDTNEPLTEMISKTTSTQPLTRSKIVQRQQKLLFPKPMTTI